MATLAQPCFTGVKVFKLKEFDTGKSNQSNRYLVFCINTTGEFWRMKLYTYLERNGKSQPGLKTLQTDKERKMPSIPTSIKPYRTPESTSAPTRN